MMAEQANGRAPPGQRSVRPHTQSPVQVEEPRVGVGVIVLREGLVLLGLRHGSHGAGTWGLPGGHLEFGESIEECAVREVLEETGLEVTAIAHGPYTSDMFHSEHKHYVTLFTVAQCAVGEPRVLEPQKCARWEWFPWSGLPSPLFQPLATLQRTGYAPPNTAKPLTGTSHVVKRRGR